jgi:hypothetical protein
MGSRALRLVVPLAFFCNACVFLLVVFLFYPSIVDALVSLEEDIGWPTPSFWDLRLVLKIVRVVFAIVGILLLLFGAASFFWLRRVVPVHPDQSNQSGAA